MVDDPQSGVSKDKDAIHKSVKEEDFSPWMLVERRQMGRKKASLDGPPDGGQNLVVGGSRFGALAGLNF